MRDLAVLLFMAAVIPLSFFDVNIAYLLWAWSSFISLNSYLYGPMAAVPYVQLFAIITLFLIITKNRDVLKNFEWTRTSVMFTLFLVHGLTSATFAYDGLSNNWVIFTQLTKTIIFCLVMPLIVTSRFRLHALVIILALGFGFHGILDGLKFIVSAGSHNARGLDKFGDNNHFAVYMAMILPIILYIYKYTINKIARFSFASMFVLVLLTVIATNSRGGLISLFLLATWVILSSRRKFLGLVAIGSLSILITQLAPDTWFERMNTIQTAEQDASFMGRVTAWKRASAIAVENPILGGGFHAGAAPILFEKFRYKQGLLGLIDTPDVHYAAATHSIYFEVLGDLGFVGLALFIACIVNAFLTYRWIKKKVCYYGDDLIWAGELASFASGSLFVFCVGGAALSIAYHDLPYVIMMILEVTKILIQKNERNLISPSR